jgi:histone deacetylase 1/2
MTVRDKYSGQDQVHTASGAGMKISNIGHSVLHTPHKKLHLRNILHVPSANKNLLYVHRLASDNDAFSEFHPNFFSIKDRATKQILHQGRCKRGLYPLAPQSSSPRVIKQAYEVNKVSSSRWHSRLGHPTYPIVQCVLRENKLPCESFSSHESVCDSCQKAKSHQLPYGRSNNISNSPLELIYSDVWGPAPISVGRHAYYVSFIDDFSKYTWIYLIKHKSDVFRVFKNFQNLVERKFDKKIISMQIDWGGEYEKLNSFFSK